LFTVAVHPNVEALFSVALVTNLHNRSNILFWTARWLILHTMCSVQEASKLWANKCTVQEATEGIGCGRVQNIRGLNSGIPYIPDLLSKVVVVLQPDRGTG
jgi:hypothetical protein